MYQQPRKKKRGCTAIGCMLIIGFIIVAAIYSAIATSGQTATVPPTPTAVAAINQVTPTLAPTDTPTPIPTDTPTPEPTQSVAQVQPTQAPSKPTPVPTHVTCQAVNGNPWCYNFSPGNLIYSPPSNFCDYFACIPSFWQSTNGYVDECNDGDYSHSGGRQGACSHHGGEMKPLYSH